MLKTYEDGFRSTYGAILDRPNVLESIVKTHKQLWKDFINSQPAEGDRLKATGRTQLAEDDRLKATLAETVWSPSPGFHRNTLILFASIFQGHVFSDTNEIDGSHLPNSIMSDM